MRSWDLTAKERLVLKVFISVGCGVFEAGSSILIINVGSKILNVWGEQALLAWSSGHLHLSIPTYDVHISFVKTSTVSSPLTIMIHSKVMIS